MADVFISYDSADRERVKPLVDVVEARGWSVWWDRQIVAGASFDETIEEELDAARCVVIVWSQNSIKSRWCRKEANEGLDRGVLVPIRIDDVRPPLAFRSSQTASLIDWPAERGELDALLAGVSARLNGGEPAPSTATEESNRITSNAGGAVRGNDDLDPTGTMTVFVPSRGTELGGTENEEADAHYQVGREFHNVDPERAINELKKAVEIDPNFALAWVTMAGAYGSRSRDAAQTEKALGEMATAAARAVSLTPDLWQSHEALGWYLMSRRDFLGANRALQTAVELARREGVIPHPGYTQYLWQIGCHTERQALINSIQHIDPLFPIAENLYYLGRREEAIAELERTRGTRTIIGGVKWWRSLENSIAIERGDREELDKRLFAGTQFEGLWGTEAFTNILRRKLASNASPDRLMFGYYSIYAAAHEDIEMALELLRREFLRDAYAGYFLIWHPGLSEVRATAGFKTFLQDLGLVEMFLKTGKWNDYCEPIGADDFLCR